MKILMVDTSKIDEMPAGPDLDVLIAEKVMGWKLEGVFHDDPDEWEGWRDAEGQGGYASPPSYSTAIEAAWDVLEKMHNGESRFHWSISSDNICDFSPFGPNDSPIYRAPRCESVPLAICRAALKAVEGEGK